VFDRLLVAVDQSEHTNRVLAVAKDLATLSGGEIFLVHVRERETAGPTGFPADESSAEAEEPIASALAMLKQAGVKAHGEVVVALHGHVARVLLERAQTNDVAIIMLGTRGLTDIQAALIGSTAHKVIHLADRPVLVVR
jgi:nucleotide-binding universal stress UspA family protein